MNSEISPPKTCAAKEEKKKNKKNTNAKRNKHWIQTNTGSVWIQLKTEN